MSHQIKIHSNGLVHIHTVAESSYIAAVIADNIELSGMLEVSGFQWDMNANIAIVSGWKTKSFNEETLNEVLEY